MEIRKVFVSTQRGIPLGYQGENEVTEVVFPQPEELLEHNWTLLHQRAMDSEAYTVPLDVCVDGLAWMVTSKDTETNGIGRAQLVCTGPDGEILKSMTYNTNVSKSLGVTSETSTGGGFYTPTVSQIEDASMTVTYTPSKKGMPAVEPVTIELPAGPAGKDGAPGKDGGPGTPGKDGADGAPGKDGVTPTIGSNGNWFLGDTDAGKPSQGATGATGPTGKDGTSGLPFSGKKLIAYGTSITARCEMAENNGGYLAELQKLCGFASCENQGWSGKGIANNTKNGDGINKRIRDTEFTSADCITIECATNDFKLNVSIGTIMPVGSSTFDTDTFAGALQDAIEYIYSQHPTVAIVLIADMQRDNAGYDIYYINSAGHKLVDYVNTMGAIADMYSIPICDLYHYGGFNALTFSALTIGDNLHPNSKGYTAIARPIAGTINSMSGRLLASESDKGVTEIDGTDYITTVANGYPYRYALRINDDIYLYYSLRRLYVHKVDDSTFTELVIPGETFRAKATNGVFGDVVGFNNIPGMELYTLPTFKMTNRPIANLLWSSNHLYDPATGEKVYTGDNA